jgi:WD40 repeat protein
LIIVTELADGSLADRYEKCKEKGLDAVPPRELLGYLYEASEALDYLHANHVTHRDIKPANLLLVGRHVKVADFGLARLLEKEATQQGTTVGTPAYMAPEVWAQGLSGHSDQYSLAVLYAELRRGAFPFGYDSLPSLMYAHLNRPPELDPLDGAEQAVLRRALAKDPKKRYPSCLAFVKDLNAAVSQRRKASASGIAQSTPSSITAVVARSPAPPSLPATQTYPTTGSSLPVGLSSFWLRFLILSVFLVSIGLGALLWNLLMKRGKEPLELTQPNPMVFKRDGEQAVVTQDPPNVPAVPERGKEQPVPRQPAEPPRLKPTVILGVQTDHNIRFDPNGVFSPDGSLFAASAYDFDTAEAHAIVWDTATGKEVANLRGHRQSNTRVAFDADGSRLASGSHDKSAMVWSIKTGKELFRVEDFPGQVVSVAFSPNGKYLATGSYSIATVCDANTGAKLFDFKGHRQGIERLAFSPDSSQLAICQYNEDAGVKLFEVKQGGAERTLKRDIVDWVVSVSFSPDGRYVVADGSKAIWVWLTKNDVHRFKFKHATYTNGIGFSKDGKRLLAASSDGDGYRVILESWDLDTGVEGPRRMYSAGTYIKNFAVSQDYERIASLKNDREFQLWQIPAAK